jgi:hypothetical protein
MQTRTPILAHGSLVQETSDEMELQVAAAATEEGCQRKPQDSP